MANELEQVLVNKTLVQSSAKGAEKLDTFSGWMLTAFGVLLAFLLGKMADLAPYLSKATLPSLVRLFLFALVVGVLAKYAAMIVSVLGASAEVGDGAAKAMDGASVNNDVLMAEFEKTAWGLNAWAVRWAVRGISLAPAAWPIASCRRRPSCRPFSPVSAFTRFGSCIAA